MADLWWNQTWNPVTGCSPVSEACEHCWAERFSHRVAGRYGYPKDKPFAVTLHEDRLQEPLHWKKPRRVAVCLMGDLCHEDVLDEMLDRIFAWMAVLPQHTFALLTKRPRRLLEYCRNRDLLGRNEFVIRDPRPRENDFLQPWPLPNLWLGVSIENQARADERIPILLQIPAAIHFVSYEPALGAVDLTGYCGEFTSRAPRLIAQGAFPYRVDWVIAGGETGPEARPAHPDLFRSVRDQCKTAAVAYFLKHLGEWRVEFNSEEDLDDAQRLADEGRLRSRYVTGLDGAQHVAYRVGKKAAGRLLDGREWDELPTVNRP